MKQPIEGRVTMRSGRRIAAIALLPSLMILAAPSTAWAQTPLNVELGASGTVSARVLVTVSVSVTCDPSFNNPATGVAEGDLSVEVEQGSGRGIAFGSAGRSRFVTCTGAPVVLNVGVTADPSGAPFHGGQAVARVFASVVAPDFSRFETDNDGPEVIKLRG